MNGDLISRSALLEDIEETVVFSVKDGQPSAEIRGANKITDRIKAAPAVDAVEVVRCGDCKFRCETDDGEYNPEDIVCTYWETDGLKACDFCSKSERRADDAD